MAIPCVERPNDEFGLNRFPKPIPFPDRYGVRREAVDSAVAVPEHLKMLWEGKAKQQQAGLI